MVILNLEHNYNRDPKLCNLQKMEGEEKGIDPLQEPDCGDSGERGYSKQLTRDSRLEGCRARKAKQFIKLSRNT